MLLQENYVKNKVFIFKEKNMISIIVRFMS